MNKYFNLKKEKIVECLIKKNKLIKLKLIGKKI